jgi:hypothetical protein
MKKVMRVETHYNAILVPASKMTAFLAILETCEVVKTCYLTLADGDYKGFTVAQPDGVTMDIVDAPMVISQLDFDQFEVAVQKEIDDRALQVVGHLERNNADPESILNDD